ncbi:hypothetical protein [Elizabethkingia anophelis]|uniref:hypothetical protein n=1 Tax=Elizabethkingia anophelis TaxID=1117645 RepID=UPI000750A449|nr:hypothetical protein [Elizabethkingia anophelis]AQW91316.1 hypothetical protein BBD28_11910 [Elizabethkingia anophelis]KUY14182.1 hypothetical protein ATB94_09290 [Elizabethkingia anophelis]
MKTLEQIKDEVAEEHVSSSWNDMMFRYGGVGDVIIDKVVHRYAREVAQASLEKAAENAIIEPKGMMTRVDKESITNEQNIPIF